MKRKLRITVRKILKDRWTFWINLFGLSVGIICATGIGLWVKHELSYDRHFKNADHIYRFTVEINRSDGYASHFARNNQTWINRIPDYFATVRRMAKLSAMGRTSFRNEDTKFFSTRVFQANPEVIDLFSIPILTGNASDPLSAPNSMMISESLAKKYFPDKPVIGEIIGAAGIFDIEFHNYKVTAVYRDFPENSHLHPEILFSMGDPESFQGWAYTYLELVKNSDPDEIPDNFQHFKEKYIPAEDHSSITPHLQPLTEIHLHSDKDREIEKNGSARTVAILQIVAVLIYLMALVNFVNMSLLVLSRHQKRFMISKILGGSNFHFFLDLLFESLITGLITLLFVVSLIPAFGFLFPDLAVGHINWLFIIVFGSILITISGIVTFLFQYWIILHHRGRLNPVNSGGNKHIRLKRSLVIFQFTISVMLIISATYINQQKNFMFGHRLGSDEGPILVLDGLNWMQKERYSTFRDLLQAQPAVKSVSGIMEEPSGYTMDAMTFEMEGTVNDIPDRSLYVLPVDDNFLDFFSLDLIAGKDFEPYVPDRQQEDYILNESAVKSLRFEDAGEVVGRKFKLNFPIDSIFFGGQIRGVVSDFNFSPLNQEVKPLVLFQKPIWYWVVLVKIDPADIETGIRQVRAAWDQVFPAYVFDFSFSDDLYLHAYADEISQADLTRVFTYLSILIAMIGLFSVSSSLIAFRTREIGIRKASGAYWMDILLLLYRNYLSWIVFSLVIAMPVAWLLMLKWKENYPLNPSPSWKLFCFAGVITFLIAWIAITYQAARAARLNPADALKYE